jgi:hypothetical protein
MFWDMSNLKEGLALREATARILEVSAEEDALGEAVELRGKVCGAGLLT